MTQARPPFRCRLALATALLLLLGGCLSPRAVEANRVLADIAAGAGPSRLKQTTPAPERRTIAYVVETRRYDADLYRPGGGVAPAAALVLVPGLTPEGKDDPRLTAFAATLARARFLVLVPDIESLRAQRVDPENVREIADAFAHLTDPQAGLAAGRAGLTAISYAVGPAMLAALEPDVRESVDLFVGIGGYHDLEAVVTFFTTGYYRTRPDAPWRHRRPNEYGKWVFVESNLAGLSDARDRELLRAMAARRRGDAGAGLGDLAAGLGPEGQSVYDLLVNADPTRVGALIAGLPEAMRADLMALDLARHDLSGLSARVILMHGRDDPIIPASQSVALAAALPPGQARLFVVGSLAHAELGPGGLFDTYTLWEAIFAVLQWRDGVAD